MRVLLVIAMLVLLISSPGLSFADELQKSATPINSATDPVDKEYTTLVREAAVLEGRGALSKALAKYQHALRIKRYEAESYYVLLDIGRVQYKMGKYESAVQTLTEYLEKINGELRVLRGEAIPPDGVFIPAYTEKGLLRLFDNKMEADALVTAGRARLGALKAQ